MRERIDISEVEAHTKIRAKYLRAIENEEWDLLPGPVYAKSFLRTYSDYLRLDTGMLVDEFGRRYERPSENDIGPVTARPRRDRPPRRMPSWVSILAVVVVILAILGVVGTLGSGSKPANTTNQQAAKTRHGVATHATRTTPKPAPPTKVTLHMIPTNPVYVCLVTGAGTKLINEQTFAPGQTIPTETASKLLLTLGNNNVQIRVNGKAVRVAASPESIRLLITPTGVKHILPSQLPTCP